MPMSKLAQVGEKHAHLSVAMGKTADLVAELFKFLDCA